MIEDLSSGYRQIVERIINKYSSPHKLMLCHRAMHKRISESFDDDLVNSSLVWIARKRSLQTFQIEEPLTVVNTINAENRKAFYARCKMSKQAFYPFNMLHLN